MGIYNCADTLPEALDSLYTQTYKSFQLILCDDGSTDETYNVAKNYADKHDNIILIRNDKNLKLAATLNRCLELVDTEYIARMDGDDISLPTRFEKEINFLDEHPEYSVVSTPMIYFDESGDWGFGKANPTPDIESFKTGPPHTHAPCMVRTEVMKVVGGYTDNKWTVRVEDYYLWYKIYKAGYRGYNLQEPLYKMRDDKNAMKRRKAKDRLRSLIVYFKVGRGLGFSPSAYDFVVVGRVLVKIILPSRLMSKLRRQRLNK